MNNTSSRFETIAANARKLGHGSHVAAAAATMLGLAVESACCWCAEGIEGQAVRLPRGGECALCPYVGNDCLLIAVSA